MNKDLIKDFLRIFISSNKNYNYDKDYALKAETHAKNKLSLDEINAVKSYLYQKTTPKNLKILDVGCNTGLPLVNFLNQTIDCNGFGIDINKQAIDSFKSHQDNISLKLYNGVNIPFEDNYFDHVILHHVIGHVKDPIRLLSEINRVLKPGATLSVITPNLWYKFFRFPHNILNNFKPDKSILRYYCKNELNKKLKISGFSNNFFFYFGDDSFFKKDFAKLRICSISKKPK